MSTNHLFSLQSAFRWTAHELRPSPEGLPMDADNLILPRRL